MSTCTNTMWLLKNEIKKLEEKIDNNKKRLDNHEQYHHQDSSDPMKVEIEGIRVEAHRAILQERQEADYQIDRDREESKRTIEHANKKACQTIDLNGTKVANLISSLNESAVLTRSTWNTC